MTVLVTVFVVLAVTIAAHELAHLVVARAVGHQVFEIQIGGGIIWSRRVGQLDIRLGPFPVGGHVQTGAPDGDGYRWRATLVALAGVVANLGLVIIGLLAFPPLVGLNVLAIIVNLWPGRRRKMGQPSSDGRAALDLLVGDVDAIAEERSGWYSVLALRQRESGDLDGARERIESGIERLGETRALLAVRGVVAFEQQRFVDVVDSYAPLIDDDRVTVLGRAGFAADAAWSASLSDDHDLRRLALPWAMLAAQVRPRDGHRRTVLAMARLDAGDLDGAAEAVSGVRGPVADAVSGMIEWAGGNEDPLRLLTAASQLADDHPLRRRIAELVTDDRV